MFTYSIKRAREIRKFHVVVVQRRQNKCTKYCDARAKLLFVNINILFFAVLLAVAVVFDFVVIQKYCYHGNVTSHLSITTFYIIYGRWYLQFIRSEFRGQLPKPYSNAPNATKIIPTQMNDMNEEEPSRYVSNGMISELLITVS